MGRLLRPHGVLGELKVEIHSDNPERFEPGSELILAHPQHSRRKVRVSRFRFVKGGGIVAFEGCATRDDAEELRGSMLEIERAKVPEAPAGSFYYYELVGCRCFEVDGAELGEVVDVLEDGGGHLLSLHRDNTEVLVPFVEAFLERVDVEGRRIDLRLPPGLVEICASGS